MTDAGITVKAKQTADRTRFVVMVNRENGQRRGIIIGTDRTTTRLRIQQSLILPQADLILSPKVIGARTQLGLSRMALSVSLVMCLSPFGVLLFPVQEVRPLLVGVGLRPFAVSLPHPLPVRLARLVNRFARPHTRLSCRDD